MSVETVTPASHNQQIIVDLTFGEKLMGITFGQSDPIYDRAQDATRLCAELANLVANHFIIKNMNGESSSELEIQLYNHTIGQILNAQMNVVKLLTLKD